MRRFRFVGNESQRTEYDEELPEFEVIYNENHLIANRPIHYWVNKYPSEYKEVFDNDSGTILTKPKPLHKDTDLGAFSAMFVASLINDPASLKMQTEHSCEYRAKWAIAQALELIKQLDNERDTI